MSALQFTDVQLKKNISGGSGAQTWLVESASKGVCVRKWGQGIVAKKLKDQVFWLKNNRNLFNCPEVINEGISGEYYFYDMNYIEPSCTITQQASVSDLTDISDKTVEALCLFQDISLKTTCGRDQAARQKYLEEKLFQNIEKWGATAPQIDRLITADTVTVQGRVFPGFKKQMAGARVQSAVESVLNEELFKFGHGDLTLSNMLFSKDKIFFIDPNPAFSGISHCQEYSKVLQSTRTQYERFDTSTDFSFEEAKISYVVAKNSDLTALNRRLISSKFFKPFCADQIMFHLAIHLCRILPYVSQKRNSGLIYFAEVLKILSAINENQSQTFLENP